MRGIEERGASRRRGDERCRDHRARDEEVDNEVLCEIEREPLGIRHDVDRFGTWPRTLVLVAERSAGQVSLHAAGAIEELERLGDRAVTEREMLASEQERRRETRALLAQERRDALAPRDEIGV